jgi:hypothetical protein
MKIAYLVLAHNNASHLHKLVTALSSDNASVFIHIDKKADIGDFAQTRRLPNVYFCENRVDCVWADFSLVRGCLNLMEMALDHAPNFDRLVLLSGACFPVQPTVYIEDFFARHPDTEFIEAYDLPNEAYGKTLGRLSHYWLRRCPPLIGMKWRLQKLINAFAPQRDYKKVLGGMTPMTGSQWWAITAAAARHVRDFMRDHPDFTRFCQNIDCPDEFFFQTLLWNSPFQQNIAHSITYTSWMPDQTGPEMIGAAHLPALTEAVVLDAPNNNSPHPKAEILFARKFDDSSGHTVDAIIRANTARLTRLQARKSA